MNQLWLPLVILGISAPVIVVQFLFYKFVKSRFFVYLLPIIAFLATLFCLFYSYYVPMQGFANLGYFVMALVFAGVFILSLVVALIFDFMKRRMVRKSQD